MNASVAGICAGFGGPLVRSQPSITAPATNAASRPNGTAPLNRPLLI